MTDEAILGGFQSLHEAMAMGFDTLRNEMQAMRAEMRTGFERADRRDAGLEQRMLRHFDRRDARLDDHEGRIAALEAQG